MEGLLSLLLFAGFVYFMIRWGSQMARGHTGHDAKYIDPVCDMEVIPDQGYGKMYQHQLYRFCTRSCLDKFDADPERYLSQRDKGEKNTS